MNVNSNPTQKEVNAMVAEYSAHRFAQAATLAQAMTARFPRHAIGWKMLGAALQQMGRYADALAPMQRAAALSPNDAEAHNNLGLTLQDLGRLDEAQSSYRYALRINPKDKHVYCNLGTALHETKQLDEAIISYQHSLAIDPMYALAHYNLGNTLKLFGRLAESETSFRRAIQIDPHNANAYRNLGSTLSALGRIDEAELCYKQALQIDPRDAVAHISLGNALHARGQLSAAEDSYRKSLEIDPNNSDAHYYLGNALKTLGRLEEAEVSFRQALSSNPQNALAYNNLGNTLKALGRLTDADASYQQAVTFDPEFADAHYNRGVTLAALGRLKESELSYRRSLQINSQHADAHSNLGVTLNALGRLDEAEACYRRAVQINPEYAFAHNNLGSTLQDLGRLDEAETCYRHALEINPDYSGARSNILFLQNYHPDKSNAEIFSAYQDIGSRFVVHDTPTYHNGRDSRRRLRVGYVSPDFRMHAARHFIEPLLAHHDKGAVEVFAYAELLREDAVSERLKRYTDQWIPTRNLSDDDLAERVRADQIDILVDLSGHTENNRLGVFGHKPAPVSVTWLGCGYTTGLTSINYLLTDDTSAPIGSENLYSEKPWRLTTPLYAYSPAEGMGDVSPLPATNTGHITFGSLTRGIRINHRVIRVWSEILKRVNGARLVIDSKDFRTAYTQDLLAEKFAAHGISRNRLQIGFHSPPWDVLRSLDIGLDCFPHNSGTTLFESLYMGVPFVTLAGRPSLGRLGSSILKGLGHPEWIATTEDEYVEKAVALAGNLSQLAALRAGLRQEMQRGPLMDGPGFARKVESAYREMFERWVKE